MNEESLYFTILGLYFMTAGISMMSKETVTLRNPLTVNSQNANENLIGAEVTSGVLDYRADNYLDKPLDAEEATVLVLSFLSRMRKPVVTPRKAVFNEGVFIVDVELKDAMATVHISSKTREIVEYHIEPHEREEYPMAISLRSLTLVLGAVIGVVFLMTMINWVWSYTKIAIDFISKYYLFICIPVLFIGITSIWWWRRS